MNEVDHAYHSSLSDLRPLLDDADDRRIYVDFDYTLLRSNSTEEFLHSGRPAFFAALMLRVMRVFQPWSIGSSKNGAYIWRDAIRTWVFLLLMPWTLFLFKLRARSLFDRFKNDELMNMLSSIDPERIVVVSNGFEWLIRQMLRDSVLEDSKIVGSSFFRPVAFRSNGKLIELQRLGLAPDRQKDIVVTDSLDDADLLDAVDNGILIEPQGLDTRWAHKGVYVPFFYTARVKRTPEFVLKQIFLEEMVIVLLATAFFHPFAVSTWVGATLLFVAFLAAYEIGYAENDRIGYFKESSPKLSQDYEEFKDMALEPAAWFWVAVLTFCGIWILNVELVSAAVDRLGIDINRSVTMDRVVLAFVWVVVVLIGRLAFYSYNRMPMAWRIFSYVALHFVKYFSLIVIFPSQPVGYALLSAQIVRTWSLYAIRRCGGDIELMASQSVRLVFFVLLLIVVELLSPDVVTFKEWHTWVILIWCIVRAAPEARRKLFDREVLKTGMRKKPGDDSVKKIKQQSLF